MAAPTQAQIRARLETMLAAIPGITLVLTTEDDTLTPEQLPAVRVYAGRASRDRTRGVQMRTVTRDWYIVLLISRIGGETGTAWTAEQKRTEEVAAEALLELIPDYFAAHPNLMIDNKQMSGIKNVDEPDDNGLQTVNFGKHGAVFWGAVYELPVTATRY